LPRIEDVWCDWDGDAQVCFLFSRDCQGGESWLSSGGLIAHPCLDGDAFLRLEGLEAGWRLVGV